MKLNFYILLSKDVAKKSILINIQLKDGEEILYRLIILYIIKNHIQVIYIYLKALLQRKTLF
jgi:hypothetical protein